MSHEQLDTVLPASPARHADAVRERIAADGVLRNLIGPAPLVDAPASAPVHATIAAS